MKNIDVKTMNHAANIAAKKLKFKPERQINENLGYWCGDYAEAFKAGALEAQGQIVLRLEGVANKSAEKQS